VPTDLSSIVVETLEAPLPVGTVLSSLVVETLEAPLPVGTVLYSVVVETLEAPLPVGTVLSSVYAETLEQPLLPIAVVPNISGTVGSPATFDGSGSILANSYAWTITSVPGGSSVSAPTPFPDGGALTPIDMTSNAVLYHANETSGTTATDTSGNGNNATLTNATVGAAGKIDTAWQNTSAIRVTPASSVIIGSDWTLSLWYYSIRPSSYATALFASSGNHHAIVNNGSDEIGVYSGIFRGSGAFITRGEPVWRHLAVVGTGGNTLFYLDGALAGTTVGYQITANATTIGGDPYNQYFAERVDEIAIWSRALSPTEIADIYDLQAANESTLTFTPDVAGTYSVQLEVSAEVYGSVVTDTATANAVISASVGGDSLQGFNLQGFNVQASGFKLSKK